MRTRNAMSSESVRDKYKKSLGVDRVVDAVGGGVQCCQRSESFREVRMSPRVMEGGCLQFIGGDGVNVGGVDGHRYLSSLSVWVFSAIIQFFS